MSEVNNREVAIKLSGVKKMYKLGQIGGGTLTADIQSWWARKRGKEDPNTKIGTDQRLIGKTFMALNGIDLTIYKGEALGIIGGNGAGKSTMLKLLSRVTAPTEGEIDIYGRITSMLEVGTGFNGEMTGRENVYLNGAILGMTKAEIDAKMEEIIEFSEVREFIDTPVKRYSSGMYVKLAFSVAAHLDSEIMIMDEVLAVGDMAFQKKCLDKMREAAKKEGRTVLYVSHNMNTIRRLCDRCVVLNQGKVVFEGEVEEGIDIYLGGKDRFSTHIDCDSLQREGIADDLVHVKEIDFIGTDETIIEDDAPLSLCITFDSKKCFSQMWFRMIIFSSQHAPVGMIELEKSFSASAGKNTLSLTCDISNLAPGRYSGRIAFYEVDEYGGEQLHDVIGDAFGFYREEKNNVSNTTLKWKTAVWGNIHFPKAKICSESIRKGERE